MQTDGVDYQLAANVVAWYYDPFVRMLQRGVPYDMSDGVCCIQVDATVNEHEHIDES